MKLRMHTKMIPGFDSLSLVMAKKKEKEAEAAAAAKAKKIAEMEEKINSLGHFQRGGTAEFVIDLDKDLLELGQIHQMIVSFAQNGLKRPVQRELLYLNDGLVFDDDYKLAIDPTESITRSNDYDWHYDSETKEIVIDEPHHHIINPKFSYDRFLNHLVLRLCQEDTYKFSKTAVGEDSEGYPYISDSENSLLTVEVKIKTIGEFGGDVITHLTQYRVYDALFEEKDMVYKKHRSNVYFGSYAGDGYHTTSESAIYTQLPRRIDLLKPEDYDRKKHQDHWFVRATNTDLCTEGIVYDFGQKFTSEGIEIPRYACVAVPINMKVRLRKDGSADFDDKDLNKKAGGILVEGGDSIGMFGAVDWDSDGNVVPRTKPISTTLSYRSMYVIDPEGIDEDNPRGEFIVWYTEVPYAGKFILRFLFEEL